MDSQPFTAILRHDIDVSPSKAVTMAEHEAEVDAQSTYFVMMSSDFYNPMAGENESAIRQIQRLGHEVGLHFDIRKYGGISEEELCSKIRYEAGMLSQILGESVKSVSWHRPYKDYLGKRIDGLEGFRNAYDPKYVREYKYCSDSMMNWRDEPYDFIDTEKYPKLQILTHPVWYDNVGILMNVEVLKEAYMEKNNSIMSYIDSIVPGAKGYAKWMS